MESALGRARTERLSRGHWTVRARRHIADQDAGIRGLEGDALLPVLDDHQTRGRHR